MVIDWTEKLLLATKLTVPQTYTATVVPRLRLHLMLDRSVQYPLTLLAAPAGFGKTTVLSAWLQERATAVAWISLGESENNLQQFWRYCIAALDRIDACIGAQCTSFLAAWPTVPIEDLLATLINGMMAHPGEILLVLDNYQNITSPEIHQAVLFLVEHLPSHAHIVMSTRVDPPFPLARLRVRRQLYEVRSCALRFTHEETTNLLIHGMQIALEPDELATLLQGTDGWIAGLQLAAMTLQSTPEMEARSQWISALARNNRAIFHYLTEEVLDTLPTEIQDFLIKTSILTQFNASLCDAVTGQTNSALVLEWLEQANLFIAEANEEGSWRCCHRLLSEFLCYQLTQRYPERLTELHLLASRWYEQAQMVNEAVEHALAAQAYEHAADLIERSVWSHWLRGETPHIFEWLAQLQDQITLENRPIMAYLFACIFLHTGQREQYVQALRIARDSGNATGQREMLSSIFDLQAYAALVYGDGSQALSYTQKAFAFNQQQPLLASSTHIFCGASHLSMGELQQAHVELTLGQRIGTQMQRALAMSGALFYQGQLRAARGQLHEALSLYLQCTNSARKCVICFPLQAHLQAGQLYAEWNDLPQVEEQLRKAQHYLAHFGKGSAFVEGDILAARLAWANGKTDQAMLLLGKAENNALHPVLNRLDFARIALLRVQYWLSKGQLEVAQLWVEQHYPASTVQMSVLEQELWTLVRARLWLAQQRPDAAITFLQPLLPTIKVQGRISTELQVQIVLVQAYAALGDHRRTKQTLEHILMLAEPGGYRRLFLDEGQGITSLLFDLYHRQQKRYTGDLPPHIFGYVHALLQAFGCEVEPRDWRSWQKRAQRAQASLDHLSERELEVLKLIGEGNSNQQIACALVVAESTIKTHLNNIYSKLNVNSRLQALTKAHAVGLLDT